MKRKDEIEPANSKTPVKIADTQACSSGSMNDVFAHFLQIIPDNKGFMFQAFDMFPIPMEVFTPDGTSVFVNRAILKSHAIPDASLIIGKYNILNDPVVNDQMGLREKIKRAFQGEATFEYDIDMPIQNLVDRGIIDEKPFEKSFMDYYLYPVKNNGKVTFVIFIQIDKKLYYGRPDLARAKAYMDSHWQSEYDKEDVAKAVNMSVTQLYRIFKEHTGITPGDYYRKVKVERIKEKLMDKNLSVKEAFASCGEDSQGWILQAFKKITGMSPKQYRENLP